jgi:hypothetical protein
MDERKPQDGWPTGDAWDEALLAALDHDDQWVLVRVLAKKPACTTELVRPAHAGPNSPFYVRKRIPLELANVEMWRAAMGCRHPLLPRVLDLYRLPDQVVVVCDYVLGTSLRDLVEQGGPVEIHRACAIACDVCSAAGALHAAGIVHRDISPSNVIVAGDGAHLVDLGIARMRTASASSDTTTLGTPNFAAPEQFGFAQTDARADVYSIGRLLAYMLIGELPGPAAPDAGLAQVDSVAPALAAVIRKATTFDRAERYQSAAELAAAIRAAEPADSVGAPIRTRVQAQPAGAVYHAAEAPVPPAAPVARSSGSVASTMAAAAREAWRTPVWGLPAHDVMHGVRATSVPRRIAVILLMVVGAFFACAFVIGNLSDLVPPVTRDHIGVFLMSCSLAFMAIVYFMGEIPAAIMGVGPYRSLRPMPAVVTLLVRIFRQACIWFAVAMAISAVCLAKFE